MTVARRILLHVAFGAAFVIAVVTLVTYGLVYDALKQRDLQLLATYVKERTQREEARFQQIQANLTLVRGQFLKRLEAAYPGDVAARWEQQFRFFPDGAWRSREQFADGRKYAQLWCHKNWTLSPEAQRTILVAQDLCEELLPGWVDSFPSVYFNFPGPANVGFDARIASWVWDMPADYDTDKMEWLGLALPKTPPAPDVFLWTGVQQDVDLQTENPLINAPMVSIFLPIYRDGVFLGSVGHDMFMTGMLDEAMRSDIAGATHLIFRGDGRLVAHPALRQRILLSKGMLKAGESGDAPVESLFKTCTARLEREFSGFDAGSDSYYSASRLAGPDWYFVIFMPRDRLQAQASASAQWVLWSGLVSLGLMLAFVAMILRRQIARPLAELTRASEAMSAGTAGVRVPVGRADELGALAQSFGVMVEQVTAREADLRQLNADLEKRVAEQTEDLREALVRERELGEMKSRFTSLVSHEFRTPLGIIGSSAQILDRYLARLDDGERREHLANIQSSVRRMAGMMDEMLVLSRMDAGRMDFTPAPLALGDLCRRVLDELHSAQGGAVELTVAPAAETPACADENLVRHILTNLLTNAHKYSPPGAPVQLTLGRENGDAVFTVRDAGIGIAEADLAHLFEAFYRGGNVGQVHGTGLGLVIVRRSCELHGGTVSVASREGAGTTFTVRLPIW